MAKWRFSVAKNAQRKLGSMAGIKYISSGISVASNSVALAA
jgi:hypothetical protein